MPICANLLTGTCDFDTIFKYHEQCISVRKITWHGKNQDCLHIQMAYICIFKYFIKIQPNSYITPVYKCCVINLKYYFLVFVLLVEANQPFSMHKTILYIYVYTQNLFQVLATSPQLIWVSPKQEEQLPGERF